MELNPKKVEFEVARPVSIKCTITTDVGVGEGLSICSVLDRFSEKKGKHIALGRALSALINNENSHVIRYDWESFPGTWTKHQMDRVRKAAGKFLCKSTYKAVLDEVK